MKLRPRMSWIVLTIFVIFIAAWQIQRPAEQPAPASFPAVPSAAIPAVPDSISAQAAAVAATSTPVHTIAAAPGVSAKSPDSTNLDSDKETKRWYAKAEVLAERATPPDPDGHFTKLRLLKVSEKYGFVRVEERWALDPATGEPVLTGRTSMVADHFMTKLADGQDVQALEKFLATFGGSIRRAVPNSRLYLVKTPQVSLDAYDLMLARLREGTAPVKYAEPDYVVHALMTPNDPSLGSLWGLNNTGQTGGTGDADIDAPEAWEVTRGSASVIVGVIDTGIDYNHPDLQANIWANAGEVPGNGLDDDGNGYVDDTRGWDFVNDDKDPNDDHYHGTHCAGTIGAVGGNGIGVAGVCHTVKLMPLKFLSSSGSGLTSDAVEAVRYATAKGAALTSNSWGGGGYSQALKDAIDEARAQGILFVAAAGNSSQNTDSVPSYPACYNSANVISVAATDHRDVIASFSNYGANTVHLGAPGVDIYSTSPSNGYRSLNGTSMACPHVAGACALIKAARPTMNWSDVRAAIMDNADGVAGLSGKVKTGGRLNVARAILISSGAYVTLTSVQASDAAGNGNGILNPGESVAIPITIKNVGSLPAKDLQTQLQVVSGAGPITVTKATQPWGTLAAGASIGNGATPFQLAIAAGTPTPHRFTVRLTTSDSDGHAWTSETEFTVLTSVTVTGRVTALTGGAPISNATVQYTGPAAGSVTTDPTGDYALHLTDGIYALQATAAGFNTSQTLSLTVPPAQSGVNFALGRSRLQVAPGSLAATQKEDQITQQSLTVTNAGDQPLSVSLSAMSTLGAAAADFQPENPGNAFLALGPAGADEHSVVIPPAADAGAQAVASLPFIDGFESGTLGGWTVGSGNGTRTVVGDVAATGSKSFRQVYTGPNGHFTGISQTLAAGSKPKHVSFWVRPGATTVSSGYFVLTGNGADAIWFFAKEGGKFYVNANLVGGDETFPYQAGVWYQVEFRDIDWTAKNFDYYVGGNLVKANVPFRNPGTVAQIDTAYLYNFSTNSEAWWDDVRVQGHTASWLSYTPAAFSLPAGQSTQIAVTFDSTNLVPGSYPARLELLSNDPANPVTNVPIDFTVQAAPNSPPVASSQTVTLLEDDKAVITLEGTDPDSNPMTASVTQLPAVGTLYQTTDGTSLGTVISTVPAVVVHPSRKVIYVPPSDANGSPLSTLQFILKDKRSTSNTATVTLNVTPVNDVPVAFNDSASALPGQSPLVINVLANDTDADGHALSVSAVTQGARGAVTNNGNGTVNYVPQPAFTQGVDSFTYMVSDGHGGSASATVSVAIGYLAAGPWATLGNGASRSGYYPASLGGQTLQPNWTLGFDRMLNQVAIADGKAFVTRDIYFNDTYVTAVNLALGTIVWRKDFVQARSLNGPSYHDGRIYVQRGNHSTDSQLWCLDAATGNAVWSAPFAAQWEVYQPAAVTSTAVYMNGGSYGGLYGFNRSTGAQLFFQSLPQVDRWAPAVGASGVYSCVNGVLKQHHPSTGVVNWSFTVDATWTVATVPVVDGNKVYVAGPTGLCAINVAATPTQAWRVAGNFVSYPSVANGRVIVNAATGSKLQAFDAGTGALLGDYLTGTENCLYQPILTNDTVIGASNSKVFLFNLTSRALLQTIPFGGIPSLSNGTLLIAGNEGTLRSYVVTGASNQAPVASAQTKTGVEDATTTITLAGTDANGDTLTALVTSLPAKGTLYQTSDGTQVGAPITMVPALVSNPARQLIFRPAPDGFGSNYASFGFRVNDGMINSAEAAVTLSITNVNDAPVAVDDRVSLRAGTVLPSFWPTANDTDADGEVLTVVSYTQPSRGALTTNPDGSLRYVPDAGFREGSATFSYVLRDAANVTATANVEIVVSESFGREWPSFGNGPDHAGRYPGSIGTAPLVERWQFTAPSAINPIAVAEGKVFVTVTGNWNSYMHAIALDAVTGAEAWRTQFQPGNSLNPPTFFKGTVYLQRGNSGSDTQLWALQASDGVAKWNKPVAAQSGTYMAPAVSDLGVYVNGGTYGGIYGFDPVSGAQKFFLGLEQYDKWTPSIYEGGVYSFVAGNFRSHHPVSGEILWSLDLGWNWGGSGMYRTVAFDGGRAYLVNNQTPANELVCIDLSSRAVLWRASGPFTGTPAVMSGVVYALAGGVVKTYGASAGLWLGDFVAPAETSLANAPVLTGDVLIAASATKTYFFHLATKAVIQTLPYGSQPAVADDVVYLSCSDAKVRALGAAPLTNRAPVAQHAQAGIGEEAQVAIRLEATDADGDNLKFVIRSLPPKGTLYQTVDGVTKGALISNVPALIASPDATIIYQAPLNVAGNGVGNFTFTAHDLYSSSLTGMVQVDIAPVNDAPVAISDEVALRPGEVLSNFHPENNDRDPDGDTLRIASFTHGTRGQVARSSDGSLQYTPDASFLSGTDTFAYTIVDAADVPSSAIVTVYVSDTYGREWPTFGGGAEHTGYLPIMLGSSFFTQAWANNLAKPPLQVAVQGGRVFASQKVYHADSSLVVLDASAGGELWRTNFTGGAYMNPPTAAGGDVIMQYSNSGGSRIYAFNAATGTTRWSSPFGAQWEEYYAPAVDATGVYVNGGTYGGMYGFNPATGAQLFYQSLEQYDQWTPTLYNGGLYSFVMGKLRSHQKSTGAVLWSLDFGWDWNGYDMHRVIACAYNRAYLTNRTVTIPAGDQELIAVDLTGKSIAWKVRGKFSGTPALGQRMVFAIGGATGATNSVQSYDADSGEFIGSYLAPEETGLSGQPIVTNDTLIVSSTAKTYIFDLKSRTLRQTLSFGGYVSLAGQTLYVASPDNYVRAFRVPDPLNHPPVAAPIAATTAEDTQQVVTLAGTDADADPLSFVITRLPAVGRLYQTLDGSTCGALVSTVPTLVADPLHRVIYVPPQDQSGAALGNFSYAVSDGKGLSPDVVVDLSVTPVNDAPVAVADTRVIEIGQILSPVRETLNDYDVDGDALTVVAFTQPSLGQVVRNSDGTLRYHAPAGGTTGADEFTYTVEDAAGVRATTSVGIFIEERVRGYWPTFGSTAAHTGYTSTTLGRSGWSQRWSYPLGSAANQVVIAEGKVFASGNPNAPKVVALDEKTGQLVWQRTLASAYSINPPTYHNGRIYVQRGNHSSDTQLLALLAATGENAWTSPHGAQWENYLAPAVSDLGAYVNGGSYGGMYGFNLASGAQLFFQSLGQTDRWTPTIAGGELFSFVSGVFASRSPATGIAIWSANLGWGGYGYSMNRTTAVTGRTAFLINDSPSAAYNDEDLVCLNLDTRAAAWTVNGDFTGTPAVNHGVVYALSANTIQARSVTDGRLISTFVTPAGELLIGQPILTDDLVIAASGQKTYLFGRYDQSLVQVFPRGGAVSVADDQLVVATSDGTIAAYAAQPAVTFSPAGGTFAQPVDVVLSAAEAVGRIYYTVDGTFPNLESAWVTSGKTVKVNWSGKIRAILVRGSAISRVNEATFTMLDTDQDGLPDWWENQRFGNLTLTSGSNDSDSDGVSDEAEFIAGTDPRDGSDFFGVSKFTRTQAVGGDIVVEWPSKSDRLYVVQQSTDMAQWTDVTTPAFGTGEVMRFQKQIQANGPWLFRVNVLPRVLGTTP